MKINKDLIIEDSKVSLKEIPVMKNNLDKIKDRVLIWNGTANNGEEITINTTWENIGKFKYLTVIILYSPTNITTSVTFPFEQIVMSDANHLNEKKRNTNCELIFQANGAQYITFIPSSKISSNKIQFNWSGSNIYVKTMYIDY